MNIKDVLTNTTAMICGRIDPIENNFDKLAGVLQYNKSVLLACDSVVLVLNKEHSVLESEMTRIFDLYKQTFKKCYFLQPHQVGMGYQIGHTCLDKCAYLFIKNNLDTKYTLKLCNDVLLSESFLDVEVKESDLYYLPSVAIGDIVNKREYVKELSLKDRGYSDIIYNYQSWLFVATNNTPVLYESDEEIERLFRLWDLKSDPRQSKLLCAEHSLVKWSIQNNLKRCSLYSPEQFDHYCKYVVSNNVVDGSLKNTIIEPHGITHLHFLNQPFVTCSL